MSISELVKNPYNPSFGRKPDRFLGRKLIVNEILRSLDNSNSPWRTTLLIGIRGSGKTALLSDIYESISDKKCITVSFTPESDILDDVLSQLYVNIPRSIISKIPKPSGITLAGAVQLELNDSKPYFLNNFRHQITEIFRELKKKDYKVLFLIDETQKHSDGMRTFISTYQHLIRENYDVHLIMAGLPNVISDILNDNVLTFLRRSNQVVLDNVELSLVFHDYKEVLQKEFDISDTLLEQATAFTGGYPYLIQLIGFYLWDYLKSGVDSTIVLDKILIQVKSMMYQNVHKLIYKGLSPGDRKFIKAMIADDNVSMFADIISRSGMAKNQATPYRQRLIESGYIKAVGRGELKFAIPFTREFLIQEIKYE